MRCEIYENTTSPEHVRFRQHLYKVGNGSVIYFYIVSYEKIYYEMHGAVEVFVSL